MRLYYICSVILVFTMLSESTLYASLEEKKPALQKRAKDYYGMWELYFDRGEYEKSIPYMKKAIDLDRAYESKIKSHVESSIVEEMTLASLEEKPPMTQSAEDYYDMWELYFDRGEYEKSIPYMKKAIDLDRVYESKIRSHVEVSIEEELIYASLAESAPGAKETAEDYYDMWELYFDRGEYEKSIPYMKKAMELDQRYSSQIKARVEEAAREMLAAVDVEKKRELVLSEERAKRLKEKKAEAPSSLAARKPLKFGPLTIRPYIEYGLMWNDNIYLTDQDYTADFISRLSIGLGGGLEIPFGLPFISSDFSGTKREEERESRTLVKLEYKPDIISYFYNPEDSNVAHTFIATSVVPSNMFGGKGKLVFAFKDMLRYTTDPPSAEVEKFLPRYSNSFEVKSKYTPTEKISMGLAYLQRLEWYTMEHMHNFNYDQYTLTPTFYYNITPKTSLFLDTDLSDIKYTRGNRNSIFYQISGGITGQATPKTFVYFKAGYQARSYQHDEVYSCYRGLTAKGSLSSQLRKDTLMKLSVVKDVLESVYQSNAYFDYETVDMEIIKNITGKLSVMAGGTLGESKYSRSTSEAGEGERTRRDYMWAVRGMFAYKILNWLESVLGYEFRSRNSNFKTFYYRNNRFTVNVRASY